MRTLLAVRADVDDLRPSTVGDRSLEHAADRLGDVAHVNERAPLLAAAVDRDLARDVGVLGHDVDREIEAHLLGQAEHRGEAERGDRNARALAEREKALLHLGLAVGVERDRVQGRLFGQPKPGAVAVDAARGREHDAASPRRLREPRDPERPSRLMLRVSSVSSSQEGLLEMPARSTRAVDAFESARVDPPDVGPNHRSCSGWAAEGAPE